MPTKPWYLSKTIWSSIVTILIITYNAFVASSTEFANFHLPVVPEGVIAALAAFGLYGRASATTTVTK